MTANPQGTPKPPVLAISHMYKTYENGPAALANVSLEIDPGTFCVVLGASGSGKTSLLRAVIGLSAVDSGTIEVDGDMLNRKTLAAIRHRISMVHQSFGLTERLSVAQNVMAGLAYKTGTLRILLQAYPKPVQARACELLAAVGLSESQANRRVRQLSGGQKQRVGIARALMNDPALILADEPVASLDPHTARDVMALLKQAAKDRGAAVLCSLHQIDLARAYADRIIGLRGGRIVFDGLPADLDRDTLSTIFGGDGDFTSLKIAAA